jgi:hypothetical protein
VLAHRPITYANIYLGEAYNANYEIPGWASPLTAPSAPVSAVARIATAGSGTDLPARGPNGVASDRWSPRVWKNAIVVTEFDHVVPVWQPMQPIRALELNSAITLTPIVIAAQPTQAVSASNLTVYVQVHVSPFWKACTYSLPCHHTASLPHVVHCMRLLKVSVVDNPLYLLGSFSYSKLCFHVQKHRSFGVGVSCIPTRGILCCATRNSLTFALVYSDATPRSQLQVCTECRGYRKAHTGRMPHRNRSHGVLRRKSLWASVTPDPITVWIFVFYATF